MKRYLVTGQGSEKGVENVHTGDDVIIDPTIATAIAVAVAAEAALTAAFQAKSAAGLVAGTGITTGTGTVYKAGVEKVGNIFVTRILIDLTGLRSTVDGDIIGVDGTSLFCHIGQITAAINGSIFGGRVVPLVAPVGGDADINLFSASVGTGTEDDAISGLAGQTALLSYTGDFAPETNKVLTEVPAADDFLYLVAGDTTDADYTTGRLLIELYGT